MNIKDLQIRELLVDDVEKIYELCKKQEYFYNYHPPMVSKESILDDMSRIPLNVEMKDKHYFGFFKDDYLVAVMDLIAGYPMEGIALIGFFMMNKEFEGNGNGSKIISWLIGELKLSGFYQIRLGVDIGNDRSYHFWLKNGFEVEGVSKYIVMRKEI